MDDEKSIIETIIKNIVEISEGEEEEEKS